MDDIKSAVIPDPRPQEAKAKDYLHEQLYGGLPVTWVEKPKETWNMPSQRNQDGSYTCVMQSSASAMEDYTSMIMSALPYKYRNGGGQGMWLQDAGNILYTTGTCLEKDGPSQNMNDSQIDASIYTPTHKITGYRTFTDLSNIDAIAEAIQAYGGVILTFGSNSLEWQLTPVYNGQNPTFYHAIYATDYTLIGGIKHLICRDSAGQYSSPEGYRLITAEYLAKRCTGGIYYTGVAPIKPLTVPVFNTQMGYGSWGKQVLILQKILVKDGYGSFTPTGFFGYMTQDAVKKFQNKWGIPNTGFVGPITIAKLNSIYSV